LESKAGSFVESVQAGFYRVPGITGRFHTIQCIECVIFGSGWCRWCGKKLSISAQRFCSERCRHQSAIVPFGNGRRLLEYLSQHYPSLLSQWNLEAGLNRICVRCGNSLTGRRRDSRFCGDACRKAHRRSSAIRTSQNTGNSSDNTSTFSATYTQRECRVDLSPFPAQSPSYPGHSSCDPIARPAGGTQCSE